MSRTAATCAMPAIICISDCASARRSWRSSESEVTSIVTSKSPCRSSGSICTRPSHRPCQDLTTCSAREELLVTAQGRPRPAARRRPEVGVLAAPDHPLRDVVMIEIPVAVSWSMPPPDSAPEPYGKPAHQVLKVPLQQTLGLHEMSAGAGSIGSACTYKGGRQRRPHQAVDRGHHFGIVEAIFRLALELRLLEKHRQDAGEAFANIFRAERHALRRQVVRLDVIAHRLAEAGAKPVLVRAARPRRNAVDVTAQVLVGRFGPLQHQLDLDAVERERRLVHGPGALLGDDLLEVVDQPFLVLEHILLSGGLVVERHLDAAMEVAGHLEALADQLRLELDLREDLRVRLRRRHRRAAAARGADFLPGRQQAFPAGRSSRTDDHHA